MRQILGLEKLLQSSANGFNSSLCKIVNDALSNSVFAKIPKVEDRIKKVIKYHTIEREPVQGNITMFAYEMLEKPENINDQSFHQAVVAAWAIELNDFMDCFDEESETGKESTNIQEGKCTWLAVKSLERCSAAQRETFTSCYGSSEPENIDRIKELYKNLELIQLYKEDQKTRYEIFMRKVKELPSDAKHLHDLFLKLLQLIQIKHQRFFRF
ncbi:farnesyl pyrophosphate synthase-like [Battus philenor]|uniref:farnesyl pyrophosphate synthase-like n=1 Tax=Battus philenor TaxID=42288 RepID=UPI0035D0C0A3